MNRFKFWLKSSDSKFAKYLYLIAITFMRFEMPSLPVVSTIIYFMHKVVVNGIATLTRIFYWTPLFKSRLVSCGKYLYLYSGMPLIMGSVDISIGEKTRISGISTICGRMAGKNRPILQLGSNVDIGWQNTLAVGSKIIIGDNVRLAGRVFLAGYPGHPVDAEARAKGLPDLETQVGDIILEDDVWLATGVTVLSGVRIGQGTIVAAGSVVNTDLPPGVLAAGMPAKVVKYLSKPNSNSECLDNTLEGAIL